MRGLFTFVLTTVAFVTSTVALPATSSSETSLERRTVGPGKVTGDTAVHDPTICKDSVGKYWLFSTGKGLLIKTSTDRTAWKSAGVVWPNGAPSATNAYTGTTNGDLWAPDCTYVNGQFRLFYAASSFGSNKVRSLEPFSSPKPNTVTFQSGIFYATSASGAQGSWTDHGLVISSSTSSNFNAIDPK